MNKRILSRQQINTELNVTPFMNLMIVLVPVLLLSFVVTQTKLIHLNFPSQANAAIEDTIKPKKKNLNLELIVQKEYLRLIDNAGEIVKIDRLTEEYPVNLLQDYLKKIKNQFTWVNSITVLFYEDIDYQNIVKILDSVRVYEKQVENKQLIKVPLFPEISLGDAY